MTELAAIILAAGEGKRMKSGIPKVLHQAAGRPLIYYPARAAIEAGASKLCVVCNDATRAAIEKQLAAFFGNVSITTVVQDPPRGTGDAARIGVAATQAETLLILYGDTPLLLTSDLKQLLTALDAGSQLALMSAQLTDPAGYGRVLRSNQGSVQEVREDRDLETAAERTVCEVNAGVYAARRDVLVPALEALSADNAQNEYYLTDIVASIAGRGKAEAICGNAEALLGVNDKNQLVAAETLLYQRIAQRHGEAGAVVRGDARIDDSVVLEPDAVVETGVHLRGTTRVESGAHVDTGCVITNSSIGPRAMVKPYTVIVESSVGEGAQVGPFAHLRPGSEIEEEAHIGNFVETKKTIVRRGAKANHLAYLGDGDVGSGANIGAGTIFCNYNGFRKQKTIIKEGAFIGSDSQLVAPVTIGSGAYVATGTTVTHDVPDDALAIGRTPQSNKAGYASKLRDRLARLAGKKP